MTLTSTTAAPSPRAVSASEQVLNALVLAFVDDPVIRWIFPDPLQYRNGFTAGVDVVSRTAVRHGAVDSTPDGCAAAVWLRPGVQVPWDDAAPAVLGAVDPSRHGDVIALFDAMDAQHPETEHWYLPFIGVEPYHQGRGLGSALLRTGLARCDRTATPAYLEASTPRNRALYQRHGYVVIGEVQAADSPPMWRMWRDAR
jgi:ribosomal protein S18 acetylase RimI-like enzyme